MKLDRIGFVLKISGDLAVEDAENLMVVLQDDASVDVDLADCRSIHATCLQVLMAVKINVAVWPADHELEIWLKRALQPALPAASSQ